MQSIIVLGGGEGPIIVIRDGKIVVIHPEGPGDPMHSLVSALSAAVRIEDAAVFEEVVASLGRGIEAHAVRAASGVAA